MFYSLYAAGKIASFFSSFCEISFFTSRPGVVVTETEDVPRYNFSIFLLSSWANEKVISTITNNTTTMFLSDKIDFINGNKVSQNSV